MTAPGTGGPAEDAQVRRTIQGVCPRCSNGRPTCADEGHTHAETCATYEWADDVCPPCGRQIRMEALAEDLRARVDRAPDRPGVFVARATLWEYLDLSAAPEEVQ